MKYSVVIPARMGSTRLSRKVLADLGGKPVLWHTWSRAKEMKKADEIIIATDHEEIAHLAQNWGAQVVMTHPDCPSGTARIASVLNAFQGDYLMNVQADEVFIKPELLDNLLEETSCSQADITTPIFKIEEIGDLFDPSVVKTVINHNGQALYFSRNAIPHIRGHESGTWLSHHSFYGHIGVYVYRRNVLEAYSQMPTSVLESMESLEQLRFLESGYRIQTMLTNYHAIAVDTQQDLELANRLLTTVAS